MSGYRMPQGYTQQYPPPPYSGYPMYVKHPQYVPNAQFYGQVPAAQYVVPYAPQYGGMVRVPQGYVVHDTCAIQCGVQCMDMAHLQGQGYVQGQGYAYPNPAYPRRSYHNRSAYYNSKRRERMMGMTPPPPPPPRENGDVENNNNASNVVDSIQSTLNSDFERQENLDVTSQNDGEEMCEMQEMQEIVVGQGQQEQIEELSVENQQCDQQKLEQ
eukprot:TRINITY_DN17644_c0_g1_i3.p3 TRINITY_DN17644_c0_g1~~TRINITY_DN17644_c0_g1_i3.p3  ORF type:complete len:249 (-),score=36.12 TRINITY_DN17644_c0_g1_i3:586-1227(-)